MTGSAALRTYPQPSAQVPASLRDYLTSQVAMGRVGEPDDIAAVVAALLSDVTQWVAGQRIEISGRQSL